MFQRLRAYCYSRRRLVCLPALLLALAVLALVMAVQAPAAAAHTVLIVAPHPDDDLIYGAGVLANARAAGDTVKVVYMTNGDLTGVGNVSGQGLWREDEAVAGQTVLGTPESDLMFLGYPDTGLLTLFEDYRYADPASAFTGANGVSLTYGDRGLGGSDYHDYHFGSHANYNRPNVLADLEAILTAYHPDDIYTTGLLDIHTDHEATYDFVKLALLDLMAAEPTYQPTLHSTIVHTNDETDWPKAGNPTTPMTAPPGLPASGPQSWSTWEQLPVPAAMQSTNEATNPKVQAIAKHVSQGGTDDFLGQFVHSDEIFWPEALSLPTNIGPLATATASSASDDQTADKAIDGVVDGVGGSPGDYSKEWASSGQKVGAWLKLTWPSPVWIDHIVLYDRPNTNDQITGATLAFSDGSNVSTGSLPNDGSAKTINFTPRAATSVTMTVTSVSGTTTNVGLAEMEVDRVLPPTGSFAIGNNATYTTTATPTLNNAISDDTALQMQFSNGNGIWSGWEAYSATKSWPLASGDGTKTVSAQFKDAAGNVYATSDTIILDTTPPAGSFTITGNSGATYTNTTAVTLNNPITDANGVTQMRFANGSDASGAAWQAYSATKAWTLPSGDGAKSVAAQFQDAAGNIYTTSYAITLDQTPPSGSVTIDDAAQYTNTTAVTLNNAVSDASGVTQMQFSNGNGIWSAWQAYSATKAWTLPSGDGLKSVAAQFQDAAGNIYATSSSITLDTTNPSGSFTITGNRGAAAQYTDTPKVTLTCSVSAGVAMQQMRFANGSDALGAWEPFAATKSWTLSAGNGLKTVSAQFKSASGNIYATTSSITLDTTKPQSTAPYAAHVRRGAWATLKFRINDGWPKTGTATVTLKIKTHSGKTVKTIVLKARPVNTLLAYRFRCKLKRGSYRFYVSATDAAGNGVRKAASNRLTVR